MNRDSEYTYNKTVKFLMGSSYAIFGIAVISLLLLGLWSKPFAPLFAMLSVILIFRLSLYYSIFPYRVNKIIIKKEGLLIKYWFRSNKQFNWERLKSLETGYSGGKICRIESYLGPISFRIDDFFGLQNGSKLVGEIIRLTNFSEYIDEKTTRMSFRNINRINLSSRKTYKRL